MSLLIKDHKKWSIESGDPFPSRPVISGNNGLNCHISEIISQIIEPVAFVANGSDIDSTDDLLAKVEKLNLKLKSELPTYKDVNNVEKNISMHTDVGKVQRENISNHLDVLMNDDVTSRNATNLSKAESVSDRKGENLSKVNGMSDGNAKFKKNDIRSFGVLGSRTSDSDEMSSGTRLKKAIESLRNKRQNGSIILDVCDRLNASKLVDMIEDGFPIKIPTSRTTKFRGKSKQKLSDIVIVGADVKSLFPSLRNLETAKLAKYGVLNSDVQFDNWDFVRAS